MPRFRRNGHVHNSKRHNGNITVLLLVIVSAAAIGLLLAWLKHRSTFDGVHENLMIYQSRKVAVVYSDEGATENSLTEKVITEFPLAEVLNGVNYDFGVAEPGEMLQHVFKVKNSGTKPLELALEGVTCKCLTMGLEKNKVAIVQPGEVFDIALEWRSDSLTKNFQQYARIKTNDPDIKRSKIELKVTGRIVSPVLASPERVSCHLQSAAESKEFEFLIHAFESQKIDPATFDINSVVFSNALLADYLDFKWEKLTAAEIEEEEGSVSGYRVTGTVKAGAPIGTYIGKLEAETSSGHPIGLDLAVKIDAPVEVRPINRTSGTNYYPESQIIEFGIVAPGEAPEMGIMMLYNIDDPNLEVKLADPAVSPAGFVQAEILRTQKTKTGMIVQLKVAIPKDCPKAQYNGPKVEQMLQLKVQSNSEYAKEVVFYLSFAKN